MTYKQIETSREIRQWIGLTASTVMAIAAIDKTYPELRFKLGKICNNLKKRTKSLFKKGR